MLIELDSEADESVNIEGLLLLIRSSSWEVLGVGCGEERGSTVLVLLMLDIVVDSINL